jgi:hypothetical protein
MPQPLAYVNGKKFTKNIPRQVVPKKKLHHKRTSEIKVEHVELPSTPTNSKSILERGSGMRMFQDRMYWRVMFGTPCPF